jgi:hypothetical protein
MRTKRLLGGSGASKAAPIYGADRRRHHHPLGEALAEPAPDSGVVERSSRKAVSDNKIAR